MSTQCTIVYYYIYLHTDDMKYREEAEEKKRKHINGEISIFEIDIGDRINSAVLKFTPDLISNIPHWRNEVIS